MNLVNEKMKRNIKLSQEKGAGAWLTAAPVKSLGFSLNKQGIIPEYGCVFKKVGKFETDIQVGLEFAHLVGRFETD